MEGSNQLNRFDGNDIDWTQSYALIGEFVVEFEGLINWIRMFLTITLKQCGLRDGKLSEVIFHSPIFTAMPLFEAYRNMVCVLLPNDVGLHKRLKDFAGKMESVTKDRNMLLHGTYHFGRNHVEITNRDKPTEFHFNKKVVKAGKIDNRSMKQRSEIIAKIEEVKKINDEFRQITSEVMMKSESFITHIKKP